MERVRILPQRAPQRQALNQKRQNRGIRKINPNLGIHQGPLHLVPLLLNDRPLLLNILRKSRRRPGVRLPPSKGTVPMEGSMEATRTVVWRQTLDQILEMKTKLPRLHLLPVQKPHLNEHRSLLVNQIQRKQRTQCLHQRMLPPIPQTRTSK